MLFFLPPLLWIGMISMRPPKWAREGNLALAYPYLLAGVWFAIVALIAGV